MKLCEVTVKVSSVIENIEDNSAQTAERNESVATGYLHDYGNGRYLVTYSENTDGGSLTTEISVSNNKVTVSRKGAIESLMSFEEGVCHSSVYSIPPYRFDTQVIPDKVSCRFIGEKGRIELLYKMRIGGQERSAGMKIWILPNSSHA